MFYNMIDYLWISECETGYTFIYFHRSNTTQFSCINIAPSSYFFVGTDDGDTN